MNKIHVIHLSDTHFVSEDHDLYQDQERIWEALTRDALNITKDAPVYIVVTGDLSMTGQQQEFNVASRRLAQLQRKINNCLQVHIVPGNHDFNQNISPNDSRKSVNDLFNLYREDLRTTLDDQFKNDIHENSVLYQCFSNFWNMDIQPSGSWDQNGVYSCQDSNMNILFVGINTAWTCTRDVKFPLLTDSYLKQAANILKRETHGYFRILLLHHPFPIIENILGSQDRRELLQNIDLMLTGHTHDPYFANIQTPDRSTLVISAAASHSTKHLIAYGIITLELDEQMLTGIYDCRICQEGREPIFVQHIPAHTYFTRSGDHVYAITGAPLVDKDFTSKDWRSRKALQLVDDLSCKKVNTAGIDKLLDELWSVMIDMLKRSLFEEASDLVLRVCTELHKKKITIEEQRRLALELLQIGIHKSYPRVFDLTPAPCEYAELVTILLSKPLYCRCMLAAALVGNGEYERPLRVLREDISGEPLFRALAHYLRGYAYRKMECLEESLAEMKFADELIRRELPRNSQNERWDLLGLVLQAQVARGMGVVYRKKFFELLKKEPKNINVKNFRELAINNYDRAIKILDSSKPSSFPLARADIHYSTGYFWFELSGHEMLNNSRTNSGRRRACEQLSKAVECFRSAIQDMLSTSNTWDAPFARLALSYQLV